MSKETKWIKIYIWWWEYEMYTRWIRIIMKIKGIEQLRNDNGVIDVLL